MAKEKSALSQFKQKNNALFRNLPDSVKAHSRRVQYYSELIFDKLLSGESYSSDELIENKGKNALSFGAKMHDIGKLTFDDPEMILAENAGNDAKIKYQSHTSGGEKLVNDFLKNIAIESEKDNLFVKTVVACIGQHHENFDGSGYPNGNCASQIPLGARIVAVADVFDSLVSGNDSRDALPFNDSLQIIKSGASELFDPVVVSALEGCIEKIESDDRDGKISKVSGGRKSLRAIQLLYRPVYDYNNRSTYGYQTRLRLNDKKCGQLEYDAILKVAEKTNKIIELSKWAVQEACEAVIRLDKKGRYTGIMFIDLSTKCFNKKYFVDNVIKTIQSYNLSAEDFCFVIPESSISIDVENVVAGINNLRENGFKVAIGGFGSEYANIAALEQFDVDYVMLDSIFAKNVLTSNRAKKICDSIIDMANKLDMLCIADGVDSKELAVALFNSNCALMRGPRFGKYQDEQFV